MGIMVNVLVKNIMVLKNVMNVLMDILVSLIAKHVLVMIKGLKVPLVMLVDNVHVNLMLLEVIVMNVNMSIMDFQIAKLVNVMKGDLYWMNMGMPLVLTMEDVLVRVPILLGINVINVLQVTP